VVHGVAVNSRLFGQGHHSSVSICSSVWKTLAILFLGVNLLFSLCSVKMGFFLVERLGGGLGFFHPSLLLFLSLGALVSEIKMETHALLEDLERFPSSQ